MSILCARLNNGVLLPAVSLGTYTLKQDDPLTTNVIQTALTAGYRAVDTAFIYENERTVGSACQSWDGKVAPQADIKPFAKFVSVNEDEFHKNFSVPHGDPSDNHKVFVTSKCWITHFTAQGVQEQLAEHLKNMKRTMADMFLLHWPGAHSEFGAEHETAQKDARNPEKRKECWREMEKLYQEKKIRAIGLSNYMPQHLQPLIDDILDRKSKGDKNATMPMFNQFEISPMCTIPKDLKEMCDKYEIQIGSYSTLGGGPGAKALLADKTLGEIAEKNKKPVANIALRWALQHGCTILPKSANPDRVKANFDLFNFSLTDSEMGIIDKLNAGTRCCPNPHEIV